MRIKFYQKRKIATIFMFAIFFLSIPVNHLAFAEQGADIMSKLIGYWSFDEGAGINVSGLPDGIVGKLQNGPTWGNGKIGSALFFDNKDDTVIVGNYAELRPKTNKLTVTAWVNPEFSLNRWGKRYVLAQRAGRSFAYQLGFDSPVRNYIFAIHTKNKKKYTCSFNLSSATHENGQWKHLAGTYDGINLRVYSDSVLLNTCPASGKLRQHSDGNLFIGSWNGTKNFYKGGIDDVRIYSRALDKSEITKLYKFKGDTASVSNSQCSELKKNDLKSGDSSDNPVCVGVAKKDVLNQAPEVIALVSKGTSIPLSSKATPTIPTVVDPIYNHMRKVFLNINPDNFDELVFNNYVRNRNFLINSGANIMESRINEGGGKEKKYGGNHWCRNNSHGNYSLCRYMTGGMLVKKTSCGLSMNNDYSYALEHPENICNPERWSNSNKAVRIWLGAGRRDNFIKSLFKKMKDKPMNRLCFEMELPQDRMSFPFSKSVIKQMVNTELSDDNLDNLKVELGTYTSVYGSNQGNFKNDPEAGGTFNRGGTHFYHKPSTYGVYPLDKIYALNQNTVVACFAEAPSGVRSKARPPYSYNPLMTVVGDNSDGKTNAYSYMSYLTRVYFDIVGAQIKFPATVKFNKIFALYENNDIQALSGNGSVLGVDMITAGNTAQYPFTIFNGASEDRTYRVTFMAGGNLPLKLPNSTFKIYLDDNQDGIHDYNENIEIKPKSLFTLSAQTDVSFIILHTPNFSNPAATKSRYDRKFSPAGVTFQEIGRLRMTSYAIRTWQGIPEEIPNKATLLQGMVYFKKNSAYEIYAKFNQDKSENKRLVRNTPDYRMAIAKMNKKK